jgi:hypothetical protein
MKTLKFRLITVQDKTVKTEIADAITGQKLTFTFPQTLQTLRKTRSVT